MNVVLFRLEMQVFLGRSFSHFTSPLQAYRFLLIPRSCGRIPLLATCVRNKSNFGGLTFDPYSFYRKKIRAMQLQRLEKIELVSRDRREREIDLPIHVPSINMVIAPIIPLEPYARAPIYTELGLKQRYELSLENLKVIYAGYIIKKKLKKIDPFVSRKFARWAQEKYIEMHAAREVRNYGELKELTTINLYERLKKKKNKVSWTFLEEMERPRVVSARVVPFNSKDNLFAQLTVRMSYKQILATYDRSGKLLKDRMIYDYTGQLVKYAHTPLQVICYVVFERHMVTPQNTSWKISCRLPNQLPWKTQMELKASKESTNVDGKSANLSDNL